MIPAGLLFGDNAHPLRHDPGIGRENEAGLGIAVCHITQSLSDVLAEHTFILDRAPKMAALERLAGPDGDLAASLLSKGPRLPAS